jgi:hypothetical protein
MKWVLGTALVVSLISNGYLALRWMKVDDAIEAGVHAEMVSTFALSDLAYFLRKSGTTKTQLLELARQRPVKAGAERSPPELKDNRFVWFPLEVTFTEAGTIDQIRVAGDAY